jgi:hypothetical protein
MGSYSSAGVVSDLEQRTLLLHLICAIMMVSVNGPFCLGGELVYQRLKSGNELTSVVAEMFSRPMPCCWKDCTSFFRFHVADSEKASLSTMILSIFRNRDAENVSAKNNC